MKAPLFGRRPFLQGLTGSLLALVMGPRAISFARAEDEKITKTWAIAEFGEPLYKDGMAHWPYANPDAPKGGKVVLGDFGTYDTLNPLILKGEFPSSIGLISDSLMVGSGDELLAQYGLIAESAEYPADKSWIVFNINPAARYHDGTPITAEDFAYGFSLWKEHGRPFLKSFIEDIVSTEVLSPTRIKYNMRTKNNMKPLVTAAGFSPWPKHYWESRDITKTTLEPPLGSGAYRIKDVDPGRSITYERVKDYWAADLPVNRGLNNFDEIRYDFYRDPTVEFEAFKAGKIDFRSENSAKRWASEYDLREVDDGDVILEVMEDETPQGLAAYFFNLRRPQFQDKRVRQALGYLYDFEAIQRTVLYGYYDRAKSYFPNSDYGASGPPTPEELAILEPFKDRLAPEVMTEAFEPPQTDGSGHIRDNLRKALTLFKEAGWEVKDGRLLHSETGEQFSLEIMTASPEQERLALPFIRNLKRAGIDAQLRIVDVPQWRNRIDQNDYDVYSARNNFFPPPGSELRVYFGTELPGQPGSGNRSGYSDPVADALIEQVIKAETLETLKATTRALDRVVLWNFNVVPMYYRDEAWLAYWNKFDQPERRPRYDSGFPTTWWWDGARAESLAKK